MIKIIHGFRQVFKNVKIDFCTILNKISALESYLLPLHKQFDSAMNILINNGIILPMTVSEGDNLYFKGYIGIEDEKISLVSSDKKDALEFAARHPDAKQIDATGKIVMPGLINTHTHVAMALLRGISDDVPLME